MDNHEKRIVYVIRSDADPNRHYTGITSDITSRLEWHNTGPCGCTVYYRPWSLVVAIHFTTERAARRFEKYLKSGSGREFAKRHLGIPPEPDRTSMPTPGSMSGGERKCHLLAPTKRATKIGVARP